MLAGKCLLYNENTGMPWQYLEWKAESISDAFYLLENIM